MKRQSQVNSGYIYVGCIRLAIGASMMMEFSIFLTSSLAPEVTVMRDSQHVGFDMHTNRVLKEVPSILCLNCHSTGPEER